MSSSSSRAAGTASPMTRRALPVFAAAAALVALSMCSSAVAHDGGGARGFRSTVEAIKPAVAGLDVTVRDSDDRLRLRNETGQALVILGYEGEPYLVFREGRVFRNAHSPATYLNDDRYGKVALPAEADASADPTWEEVAPRETYEWHDHRIHWMSTSLPPKVEAAKDSPHHVFDWEVPATLDGRTLAISGSLVYEPPPDGHPTILVLVLAAVVLAAGALVVLRRLSRR